MSRFEDAREFWNQRFDTPEYVFGREPNVFLAREAARLPPGARVLDVACGEGRNAVWLARQGHHVTAFDLSPLALAKARDLAAAQGVSVDWRESDVNAWDWSQGGYDAVCCIFIQFASPEERARLFGGFLQTLRPGGWVFLQGYTPRQLQYRTGGPGQLSHLYTAALLQEAFAGFQIETLREHDSELAEGNKHVGISALVDLVARRPG